MNRFYGQFEQDKFIYERYFVNRKNGIAIECGAFDGIIESSTYFFEETLNWLTINIEAAPPIFEMLIANRPNSININAGLGNKNGISIFNHVIHPQLGVKFGNGSFNHTDSHKKSLESDDCEFEQYSVETITYSSLIDGIMDSNFKNRDIDLFVLDVEGLELEVLNGMIDSNYLPTIMCIEYPHVGLTPLKKTMANLHYSLDTLMNNNAYFIKK